MISFAVPPGLHGVAAAYLRRLARELSDDEIQKWGAEFKKIFEVK